AQHLSEFPFTVDVSRTPFEQLKVPFGDRQTIHKSGYDSQEVGHDFVARGCDLLSEFRSPVAAGPHVQHAFPCCLYENRKDQHSLMNAGHQFLGDWLEDEV